MPLRYGSGKTLSLLERGLHMISGALALERPTCMSFLLYKAPLLLSRSDFVKRVQVAFDKGAPLVDGYAPVSRAAACAPASKRSCN